MAGSANPGCQKRQTDAFLTLDGVEKHQSECISQVMVGHIKKDSLHEQHSKRTRSELRVYNIFPEQLPGPGAGYMQQCAGCTCSWLHSWRHTELCQAKVLAGGYRKTPRTLWMPNQQHLHHGILTGEISEESITTVSDKIPFCPGGRSHLCGD